MTPTLSIITINYNNKDGLKKTIESVVNQTQTDFEYIIIDGASTDGSVNVIKEYAEHPVYGKKITHWVSEPDSGIYNAMNKGIRLAKGEYVHLLNSGDWYEKEALSYILPKLQINTLDALLVTLKLWRDSIEIRTDLRFLQFLQFGPLSHQGLFYKRNFHAIAGFYNEIEYKYVADYDFCLKAFYGKQIVCEYIEKMLINFVVGGLGESPKAAKEMENIQVKAGLIAAPARFSIAKTILKNMLPYGLVTHIRKFLR